MAGVLSEDRVQSVEAVTVSLPLAKTVWASGLRITQRDFLVVRVRTKSGRCGYGFHKSRGITLDRIVRDNLAPSVIGKSPWEVERIWDEMYRTTLFSGRTGAVMRALGTVDIALWDLRAQLAGAPLHRLLGGYRSECRILLVTGYYEEDPHELKPLLEDVEYHALQGIDFFKIAAGMLDLTGDTRRIAEARRVAGEAADLAVDVNWVWSDLKQALRAARLWEPYRLSWIEEPFPPGSTRARRRFAQESPIPLAIGDEQSGVAFFRDLIHNDSVDVVRVDTPVVGGITPTLRIIALADAAGLPVSPHIYPEINIHLAAAFPNVVAVEMFSSRTELYQIDRFISSKLELRGGAAIAPSQPGLGFDLDWESLLRHTI